MEFAAKGFALFRRLDLAARTASYCAGAVLCAALVAATFAWRQSQAVAEQTFRDQAAQAQAFTTVALRSSVEHAPEELLRSYFQIATEGAGLNLAALIIGQRIAIAHTLDWEGLEANYVLGQQKWDARKWTALRQDGLTMLENRGLQRFEAVVPLQYGDADTPVLLYLACETGPLNHAAWHQFWAVFRVGALLAVMAAAVAYFCCRRSLARPLGRLRSRIEEHGLLPDLATGDLGELADLAAGLESATCNLLQQADDSRTELQRELCGATEASTLQGALLEHLLKDLRRSMSAILGYSEMLMASESKPVDRINHIRSIQQESRRVSRLAREVQEVLRSATNARPSQGGGFPSTQLRALLEKLSAAQSTVLKFSRLSPGGHKLVASEDDRGVARSGRRVPAQAQAAVRRLNGAVLVMGRKDEGTLTRLQGLGISAVWVPDLTALLAEVSREQYHVILLNLARGDRTSLETSSAVRDQVPDLPVVAILPASARGEGTKYVELGFDDYLYAPTTRPTLLAVLGKFVEFTPV